jgi:cystathionine beta-lyase/cystathionine gamma-synthase
MDLPASEVRKYGLGHIIKYARQKAINRIFGLRNPAIYPNSMPLMTESAFEYMRSGEKGASEVAEEAFGSFSLPVAELESHYIYQRLDGPNDTALAQTLAETMSILSGRNIQSLVANSGMSIFTAFLGLLRPGDTLIYHPILYGCTKNKIKSHLPKMNIKTVPNNLEDLNSLRKRCQEDESLRMLLLETELNPNLHIPPLEELAQIVTEANATRLSRGWRPIFLIADNTFPTFANLNLFNFGYHTVVESLTKFICGTGENMGGAAFIDMQHEYHLGEDDYGYLHNFLKMMQKDDGLSLSPFAAWDILRMLPSMEMRRSWVQKNAVKVAEFLKNHPYIRKVSYPGISVDEIQNQRARKYMVDEMGDFAPGYMIYFVLKGEGDEVKTKGRELLDWLSDNTSLKVKVSFGQQDTLIEMPSIMTHSSYSREELIEAGIDEGGIRLAVGWDGANYIMNALAVGLQQVF